MSQESCANQHAAAVYLAADLAPFLAAALPALELLAAFCLLTFGAFASGAFLCSASHWSTG